MDRKLLFARACILQIESIDRRKDKTFALAIAFSAATVFTATCASVAGLASSDLLLYLIRKQNLDILDIPVLSITQQYVAYIELIG